MFNLKNVEFKNILNIDQCIIKREKITAILGSSGGGKTTFLKLLNNMISADKGEIKYNNQKIQKYDPVKLRREIVMLPQNPVIFEGSIKDNLEKTEIIADKKISSQEKYLTLLKKVNLSQSLNKNAAELSGGEKQRLALARVILLEAKVLLLDEPSSSLDQKTERKIIKMVVKYIKENNKTLIMVTHNKNIAEKYSDEIIKIEKGKIV